MAAADPKSQWASDYCSVPAVAAANAAVAALADAVSTSCAALTQLDIVLSVVRSCAPPESAVLDDCISGTSLAAVVSEIAVTILSRPLVMMPGCSATAQRVGPPSVSSRDPTSPFGVAISAFFQRSVNVIRSGFAPLLPPSTQAALASVVFRAEALGAGAAGIASVVSGEDAEGDGSIFTTSPLSFLIGAVETGDFALVERILTSLFVCENESSGDEAVSPPDDPRSEEQDEAICSEIFDFTVLSKQLAEISESSSQDLRLWQHTDLVDVVLHLPSSDGAAIQSLAKALPSDYSANSSPFVSFHAAAMYIAIKSAAASREDPAALLVRLCAPVLRPNVSSDTVKAATAAAERALAFVESSATAVESLIAALPNYSTPLWRTSGRPGITPQQQRGEPSDDSRGHMLLQSTLSHIQGLSQLFGRLTAGCHEAALLLQSRDDMSLVASILRSGFVLLFDLVAAGLGSDLLQTVVALSHATLTVDAIYAAVLAEYVGRCADEEAAKFLSPEKEFYVVRFLVSRLGSLLALSLCFTVSPDPIAVVRFRQSSNLSSLSVEFPPALVSCLLLADAKAGCAAALLDSTTRTLSSLRRAFVLRLGDLSTVAACWNELVLSEGVTDSRIGAFSFVFAPELAMLVATEGKATTFFDTTLCQSVIGLLRWIDSGAVPPPTLRPEALAAATVTLPEACVFHPSPFGAVQLLWSSIRDAETKVGVLVGGPAARKGDEHAPLNSSAALFARCLPFHSQRSMLESGLLDAVGQSSLAPMEPRLRTSLDDVNVAIAISTRLAALGHPPPDPIDFARMQFSAVHQYAVALTQDPADAALLIAFLALCRSRCIEGTTEVTSLLVAAHADAASRAVSLAAAARPLQSAEQHGFAAVKYVNDVARREFGTSGDLRLPPGTAASATLTARVIASIAENAEGKFTWSLVHRVLRFALESSFLGPLFVGNARWRRTMLGVSALLCLKEHPTFAQSPEAPEIQQKFAVTSFLPCPQLVVENLLMCERVQEATALMEQVPTLRSDEVLMHYALLAIDLSCYDNCGENEFPFGLAGTSGGASIDTPVPLTPPPLKIWLRPENSTSELERTRQRFQFSSAPNFPLFQQLVRTCADVEYASTATWNCALQLFEGLGEHDNNATKVIVIDVIERMLRCSIELKTSSGMALSAEEREVQCAKETSLLAKLRISRHLVVAGWDEHPTYEELGAPEGASRLLSRLLDAGHINAAFAIAEACGVDLNGVPALWIDRSLQLLRLGLFDEAKEALRHLGSERIAEVLGVLVQAVEHVPLAPQYVATKNENQVFIKTYNGDDVPSLMSQRSNGIRSILEQFGTEQDMCDFQVRIGDFDGALECAQRCKLQIVPTIFLPAEMRGTTSRLQDALRRADPKLESVRTVIFEVCKHLEGRKQFSDLLQWQQWYHDYARAAQTAITIALEQKAADQKVSSFTLAESLFVKAKFQPFGNSNRGAVAEDGTLLPACRHDPQALQRMLLQCRLQKELTSSLSACGIDIAPYSLYKNDAATRECVEAIVVMDRKFYDLACSIIGAFNLPLGECFGAACAKLSKAKKVDTIEGIVDYMKRGLTFSSLEKNIMLREIIRALRTDHYGNRNAGKLVESCLAMMTVERGHRVAALLACGKLLEAYKDAAMELQDSDLVLTVFNAARGIQPPTTNSQHVLELTQEFLAKYPPRQRL